jgi:hypothetical protein
MSNRRVCVLLVLVVLGGLLALRLTGAQPAAGPKKADEEPSVGRYKTFDIPVGKFIYRTLFDTMTADYWLWVNGEWERAEPPKGGAPWKDLKPVPGRFHILTPPVGELDREMYVLDTATGRMWVRRLRDRTELLVGAEWTEVPLPRPRR